MIKICDSGGGDDDDPTKTQFICFGTRQQLAKIDLGLLATKYPQFTFSSCVLDLGGWD